MKKINEDSNVSFIQAVKDYFIGFFNFKGTTSRRGFWFGVIPALLLNGLLLLAINYLPVTIFNHKMSSIMMGALFQSQTEQWMSIFGFIIILFIGLVAIYLFAQIGLLALISRRLRHIGLKSLGIICWLIFFVVIQSLSYQHDALGFFVFLLQLVTFVIQIILLSLSKHALVVSSDSFLSHFIMVTQDIELAEQDVVASEQNKVILTKKTLSDVDREQLTLEKKYIQK